MKPKINWPANHPGPDAPVQKPHGSQLGQDVWSLETLKNKRNGTFVDFGAAHPITINNTWVMEQEYDWTGISFDIGEPFADKRGIPSTWCFWRTPQDLLEYWNSKRKTPLLIADALSVDFSVVFKQHNLPKSIDFLSIDICPPKDSLQLLYSLPWDDYEYKTIAFEHATVHDHMWGVSTIEPSRAFMRSKGYKFIKCVGRNDDFWVHPDVKV